MPGETCPLAPDRARLRGALPPPRSTQWHQRAAGVESFPRHPAGYQLLLASLATFGTVERVGIEGTGSYGAGLAPHLHAGGVTVIEVNRSDRAARRRQGKSDPLDAISAARAAQSGRATGSSKGRDGEVETIPTLLVTKRSARRDRTATINQMQALGVDRTG